MKMSYFYKENLLLEEKVDRYFKGISEYNTKHFQGKLSVILLGSLSRGEGTFITENGRDVLVSDIEFFTVYPQEITSLAEYNRFIQIYAEEIFAENKSSLFHVDNSNISYARLPELDKKLLTYDAVHFGKCVVGENVMNLLPEINIGNINLYDIRDILTHRVFSVLYYGFPLKFAGKEEQYRYSLAKNSLDLMTVLLVERGVLESGFINRYEKIKELDIDQQIKDYFGYCLSLKLKVDSKHSFAVSEMETLFIELVKKLSEEFKVKISNAIKNIKTISRRRMGILKRICKNKKIPPSPKKHLNNLIYLFEKEKNITVKEKKDNLILNGYPV